MKHPLALAVVLSLLILGVTVSTTFAQEPRPPHHPAPAQDRDARPGIQGSEEPMSSDIYWQDRTGPQVDLKPTAPVTVPVQTSGGPDDYGYVWNGGLPLQWISAANGTDTGIDSSTYQAGPIEIGFDFKFYENSYSQLWVSRHGYVSFASARLYDDQSSIPYPIRPNDVVAPHWVPSDDVTYVRYLRGGSPPNRWFVMEWNQLVSNYDVPDEYTFEIVLYEDGTILFQYATMNATSNYWCQSSGIEDSQGIDGLATSDFCQQISGNQALRITRPAPSARVKVYPAYGGKFISPGGQVSLDVPITNTGNVGPDTFDITVSSRWPLVLYRSDGTTPLSDTDGDGVRDTGSVASGARTTVVARITSPATSSVGNSNQAVLTFRSSRNLSKAKTATLLTAVPASFAQVFIDSADYAMSLYRARPAWQAASTITSNGYFGYGPTVAESGNGNLLYTWSKSRCVDNPCSIYVEEIEYTLVDHSGRIVRGVSKLADHSGATLSTYDYNLAATVAPDGRIGVFWLRELYDSAAGQWNDNLFFAVLTPEGDILFGPVNLTNNTLWSGDLNVPYFYDPHIAASGDNRFFLAWSQEHLEADGWVNDVWYAIWTTSGVNIRSNTRLTNDTAGYGDYYESPSLATALGNRILLAFERQWDIYYTVLDSQGSVVRATERLTNDGLNWRDSDVVRASNGNFLVAWGSDPPSNLGEQPWTARYYNNETLSGTPALVRTDNTIDFNWWDGTPHPTVNADHFSVRWEGTVTPGTGNYRFWMGSDDGSRLWIDGQLVMDHWNECCQYWNKTVSLSAGPHQIRMEMREIDGASWAYLSWQPEGGTWMRYAVLNPSFQRIAGPAALRNEAALFGNDSVSATADADGNAILTWLDSGSYNPNLYYALVDAANGNVLTAPMIFHRSDALDPDVASSYLGNGNTSLIAQPQRVYLPIMAQPRDLCEPNDAQAQASCSLISDKTYRAYISPPQEWDFYAIDLPTDHVVEVWLDQIPAGQNYHLYLYAANGDLLGYSGNPGNEDEHIRTTGSVPGGRYYIAVKGVSGSITAQPYSLKSVFR